jgi:AcrR family transcriptional regulator
MTSPKRARRRRGEGQQAILDAAEELFAVRGYQGTSIRDIASRANVSEALIFRNFGTKSQLFDKSIVQPFHAFVRGFIDDWRLLDTPVNNREMVSRFVRRLYEFVLVHRDSLFALVAASRFDAGANDLASGEAALSAEIRELASLASGEARAHGLEQVNLEVNASSIIAMVFGMALLDDWLLAFDPRPTTEYLLDEMTALLVDGLDHRLRPR